MIDVTRAVQLGWVEDCSRCAEGRKRLAALIDWEQRAGGYIVAKTKGTGKVEIVCTHCNGRGWTLTPDGQQLVDLVQELYPQVVATPAGEEIPF